MWYALSTHGASSRLLLPRSIKRGMSTTLSMAERSPDVIACNIYISEGRNRQVIEAMQAAAASEKRVALLNTFIDEPYNRTGFTLVATEGPPLVRAAAALCGAALSSLRLGSHAATHPRLGVIDHISLHPLTNTSSCGDKDPQSESTNNSSHDDSSTMRGTSTAEGTAAAAEGGEAAWRGLHGMGLAAACARGIGAALASAPWHLPVYLYGEARGCEERVRLAHIRRQLGYFSPNGACSTWVGELGLTSLSHFPPDLGPHQVTGQWGAATIGAVPWIVNWNIPLTLVTSSTRTAGHAAPSAQGGSGSSDGSSGGGSGSSNSSGRSSSMSESQVWLLQVARRIARAVSERGGGLKGVEAMALVHAGGVVEVACNLHVTPPHAVQARVEQLARAHSSHSSHASNGGIHTAAYARGSPSSQPNHTAGDGALCGTSLGGQSSSQAAADGSSAHGPVTAWAVNQEGAKAVEAGGGQGGEIGWVVQVGGGYTTGRRREDLVADALALLGEHKE